MSRQAWFRSHLGKFHGTLVYYSSDWRQSRRMGWGTMLVVSRSEELVGICGIECGEARAYQLWRLHFGKSGSWRIQRGEAYSRLSRCSNSLFRFFLVCLFLKCWSSIKEIRVIIIYQQLSLWKIIASHIFLIASCKLLYRFFVDIIDLLMKWPRFFLSEHFSPNPTFWLWVHDFLFSFK